MTTTQTLTLTEFLLARIAEDEAESGPKLSEMTDLGGGAAYLPDDSSFNPRMLAECRAKRQIVGLYDDDFPDPNYNEAAYRAMLALAAVYADHPDYRDGWMP